MGFYFVMFSCPNSHYAAETWMLQNNEAHFESRANNEGTLGGKAK